MTTRTLLARAILLVVVAAVAVGSAPVVAGGRSSVPRIAGCKIFPERNVWNRRIDQLPVHPRSGKVKKTIGLGKPLHPDFGSFSGYGIPWNVVDTRKLRDPR